jgi:hypothetical protein
MFLGLNLEEPVFIERSSMTEAYKDTPTYCRHEFVMDVSRYYADTDIHFEPIVDVYVLVDAKYLGNRRVCSDADPIRLKDFVARTWLLATK